MYHSSGCRWWGRRRQLSGIARQEVIPREAVARIESPPRVEVVMTDEARLAGPVRGRRDSLGRHRDARRAELDAHAALGVRQREERALAGAGHLHRVAHRGPLPVERSR